VPAKISTPQPAATGLRSSVANPAAANGISKRGGVTISPAFQQVSIDANQPQLTFDFSITNNADVSYEFGLSVVDFGSLDETGGVLFVGNGSKALSYRYALSPWVTLEKDRVVVEPHATEKVPVTIDNKESLTPGGHYGAILVTPTETGANAGRKVQIDQVASSLLFVKKLGGDVYRLELNKLRVRPHIFSLPGSIDVRFQNSGNVHVIPRGLVTLSDSRGRIVKRGIINADSGIVLPESFRSLTVPLEAVGSSWLPGRYKLTTTYRYDDQTSVRTVTSSFVYVNVGFVLLILLLVALVMAYCLNRKHRSRITATGHRVVRRIRQFRLH